MPTTLPECWPGLLFRTREPACGAPGVCALTLAPQGDSLVIAAKGGSTFQAQRTFDAPRLITDPGISENGITFNRKGDTLVEACCDSFMRMRCIHREMIAAR